MSTNRRVFEAMLSRRTTRRRAMQAGAIGSGIIGISFAGAPTRQYVRSVSAQGTPEATPMASPVDISRQPSAQFGVYPFQLGVASGDPTAHSVVLWTRLAPTPIDGGGMDPIPYELRWEIATDRDFANVVQRDVVVAAPTLAHAVHVDVTGLQPGTEYFYRFIVGDEVSQTGRTKTAPEAGQTVDALNVAFVSCSNYEHGYFVAYRDLATKNLDLVLHLGDYIYEYGYNDYHVREPENLRWVGGGETLTLDLYRNRYATYRTDADLQAAHASAPFAVTWDDHEVENNYADSISENKDPADEFLQRRADAYQAYYEHMPLRPSSMPTGPDMQLYRHIAFGDLLDITILDTRQYRSDHPSGDDFVPRTPNSTNPTTSLPGLDQERWLLRHLDASTSTWNAIAQQVIMADIVVPDTTGGGGGAPTYYNDVWSGYPASRQRILEHIAAAGTSNPIVLTGDIHTSWANDIPVDFDKAGAPALVTEYVCTSITAGGPEPDTWGSQLAGAYPYVKFFDPRHGGYSTAHITADRWTTDFFVVDDMEDAASGVTKIATFVTESGVPGAQKA